MWHNVQINPSRDGSSDGRAVQILFQNIAELAVKWFMLKSIILETFSDFFFEYFKFYPAAFGCDWLLNSFFWLSAWAVILKADHFFNFSFGQDSSVDCLYKTWSKISYRAYIIGHSQTLSKFSGKLPMTIYKIFHRTQEIQRDW